jgi:hypothetical protein
MFSTGFNSGARDGRKIGVMLLGTSELGGGVPSGAVEQQDGVRSLGDVAGDFLEMELHRLGVGEGQRERRPDASGGTNSAEEIGALIALVGRLAGPRSSLGPLPHEAVLLSNARFILEPDLDRRRRRQAVEMNAQRAREVFLNASMIRASWAGWRGRALMWEKPSFLRSLPT